MICNDSKKKINFRKKISIENLKFILSVTCTHIQYDELKKKSLRLIQFCFSVVHESVNNMSNQQTLHKRNI